ncbi:hypothetical protein HYT84_03690 [Candidatus Micrarchaeota archaeon]|nr:hypothetical protein [Candidatus Micrarchaeota archaeon]
MSVLAHTEVPLPKGTKATLRPLDSRAMRKSEVMLESLARHPLVKVVDQVNVSQYPVGCKGESGKLKTVVVSLPVYLDWAEPINGGEMANMQSRPDRLEAVEQHLRFILKLLEQGIEVIIIKPDHTRLEGVYTRDIGVVIGSRFIQCNMVASVRKPEELTIVGGIKPPPEVKIEGGNVILAGNLTFLGIGDRTNREAGEWLQGVVGTATEIKPILLKEGILHLDCAFSPIAKPNGTAGGAFVYQTAFASTDDLELLERVYGKLIGISEREATQLGVNVLSLDPHTKIITPSCNRLARILKTLYHQTVIRFNLEEVVKGEGYARCSTLPLLRE